MKIFRYFVIGKFNYAYFTGGNDLYTAQKEEIEFEINLYQIKKLPYLRD
jgi:hypothetical protein